MRRKNERGGCLGIIFLLGLGVMFLGMAWTDATGLWSNSEPTVMTLAEYQKERPDAKWLKLTECELRLADCVYKYNKDDNGITDVFIPLGVPDSEDAAHVILETDQFNGVIARIRDIRTEEEATTWAAANQQYFEPKEFTGWITSNDSQVASEFDSGVVSGSAVTLEDGATKSWGKAIGFLVVGLLCLIGGILYLFGSRE